MEFDKDLLKREDRRREELSLKDGFWKEDELGENMLLTAELSEEEINEAVFSSYPKGALAQMTCLSFSSIRLTTMCASMSKTKCRKPGTQHRSRQATMGRHHTGPT